MHFKHVEGFSDTAFQNKKHPPMRVVIRHEHFLYIPPVQYIHITSLGELISSDDIFQWWDDLGSFDFVYRKTNGRVLSSVWNDCNMWSEVASRNPYEIVLYINAAAQNSWCMPSFALTALSSTIVSWSIYIVVVVKMKNKALFLYCCPDWQRYLAHLARGHRQSGQQQ